MSGYCNVSTGRETTVIALAEALELEPTFQPERAGEVRRSCLDPSKAATVIGWTAKTSLQSGLEQTLAAAR